jgi:hypothetical protein
MSLLTFIYLIFNIIRHHKVLFLISDLLPEDFAKGFTENYRLSEIHFVLKGLLIINL